MFMTLWFVFLCLEETQKQQDPSLGGRVGLFIKLCQKITKIQFKLIFTKL